MLKNLLFLLTLFLLIPAFARDASKNLSRQQIYSLSEAEVEKIVLENEKESCEGLLSVYQRGEKDPAGLTPAQFTAVQVYSSSRYEINRQLWESESSLNGNDWAYVRVLDAALQEIQPEAPLRVYRGTRRHLVFDPKNPVVQLKGYTSTSASQDQAEILIRDRLMIIDVKSARNLKNYSNAGMEDEYLLPRGTWVRFERSEMKKIELFLGEGPTMVDVEFVYLTEVDQPRP